MQEAVPPSLYGWISSSLRIASCNLSSKTEGFFDFAILASILDDKLGFVCFQRE
jgi:hypothetical protein